jgi:hypothetical protein
MREDPYVIRLNIRHYQEALRLPAPPEKRQVLLRLLAEAQDELPLALAEQGEAGSGGD